MKNKFRPFLAIVAVAGILAISSCGKDVSVLFTIPDCEQCISAQQFAAGSGFTQTYTIQQADILDAFTAASTTFSESRLNSAVAKGLKLKVSGGSVSLNGLSGAQAYIKKQGTSGDGQMIASTSGAIADGASEVDLALSGTDIKSLIGGTEPLVVTLRLWNKDNSPAVCAKLSSGSINFSLKK